MKEHEKIKFETLYESDKITKKNEAEIYRDNIIKNEIEILNYKKAYSPISTFIFFFSFTTLLFFIYNSINFTTKYGYIISERGKITAVLCISMFILLWVYSLISTLSGNFKKSSDKTIWVITLFLFPLIAIFINDIKDTQIERE